MNYFPMFMDVKDREILLCGGGRHALEKLERLYPFGARLHVISEHIMDIFYAKLKELDGIVVEERGFLEKDLESYPIFVVAAEGREENERIAEACRRKHIPVNAVDMQDLCDFIFPAIVSSGQLCIGISSGGASPAAAVELKKRIGECIPENVDEILLWMAGIREEIFEKIPDKEQRRQVLRELVKQAFIMDRPLDSTELQVVLERGNLR